MSRKKGLVGLAGLGAALALTGCAGAGNQSASLGPNPATSVSPVGSAPVGTPAQAAAKASSPHSLAAVQSWAAPAALPDVKPVALLAALTAHTESLLILDPAVVTTATTAPAAPAATALTVALTAPRASKAKPLDALRQGGPRRLLATLNVADVTKSSPLWQASWADAQGKLSATAPPWLVQSDPKTPDVYPVKFWDGAWQKLILASTDKLIADGYDGVSLQGVGGFAPFQKDHAPAAAEMAALIGDLAARARKVNPAFSVLADGGTALPAALPDVPRRDYLAAVDGVLARGVFYPGDKPTDNDLGPDADVLTALDTFQKAGKAVFVTERLTDPDKIADFLARARSKGYLPDAAFAPPTPPSAPAADPKVAVDPKVAANPTK